MDGGILESREWFRCFKNAFEYARLLPEDDTKFIRAFEKLAIQHRVWCGQEGSLTIRVGNRAIIFNKEASADIDTDEDVDWFYLLCKARRVQEVLMLKDLSNADFMGFMRLLQQDPVLFENPDFNAVFLGEQHVSMIQVNPPNFEDSFFGVPPIQVDTLDFSEAEQGHSGIAQQLTNAELQHEMESSSNRQYEWYLT